MKIIIQISVFMICFFSLNIYGKTVTVRHTTGKVTVHISCFSYREEINKGIIISEYVHELSKKYNYNHPIEIFLEMIPSDQKHYFFIDKENIFLHTKANRFDLVENLKLIEFAIQNRKRILKKINFNTIINSSNSKFINEVVSLKIERPDVFPQLENTSDYSYFYQDNQYKIYNKQTKELLLSTPTIYLFSTIGYSRLIFFINDNDFFYKNLDNNLKFQSFKEHTKLYEGCKFKEIGYFIIFCTVKNSEMNVAILNLIEDKMIDNLDW